MERERGDLRSKVFFFELIVHVVSAFNDISTREIRDKHVHDRTSAHSTIGDTIDFRNCGNSVAHAQI